MDLGKTLFFSLFILLLNFHLPSGQYLELNTVYEPTTLNEQQTQEVASLMLSKNFSIMLEFVQVEHTRGTLFYVHTNRGKVFELYSSGMKGQLTVYWRRKYRVANLDVRYELDDEDAHVIIFELRNQYLRLVVDCIEAVVGEYPEIDFKLLHSNTVQAHIGKRDGGASRFYGQIHKFIITNSALSHRFCGTPYHSQFKGIQADLPKAADVNTVSESSVLLADSPPPALFHLERRIKNLEEAVLGMTAAQGKPVQEPVGPLDSGSCPNCWEFLRFKVNYLEEEFKRWREHVQTIETHMKHVLLQQRGCMVNNTIVKDGHRWKDNNSCTDCICHLGKPQCHAIGCPALQCRHPTIVDGQCCPECGQNCYYMGETYEHGDTFWPKACVQCICQNGDTRCNYEAACPQLTCSKNSQVLLFNRCCPICVSDDFCSSKPCHENAICVNELHTHRCYCKDGYFGDGVHCFDKNECLDVNACGPGSRCINFQGGYLCHCLPGYHKLNNHTCIDVIIV